MEKLSLIFVLVASLFFNSFSQAQNEAKGTPEIVVHLLDYLAKDYGGVVRNGKVINEGEYAEQVEFAGIISKNAANVEKLNNDSAFVQGIANLDTMIKSKAPADEVARLSRTLQQDAIRLAEIQVSPTVPPEIELGSRLYQQSCVTCHGSSGKGDGPAGAGLDPKPANFHDPDLVWNSAPYKFYNTIRMGVPGTGMAAFAALSDHEVWSIAYYLKALNYQYYPPAEQDSSVSAKDLATMTDAEIAEKLGGRSEENVALIASLRAHGTNGVSKDSLAIAETLLSESVNAVRKNDYATAESFAVNAYLQGIEPLEPKLRANLPGFVEQIESRMSGFRSSISSRDSADNIEAKKIEIFGKLQEARTQLSASKMSAAVAFGAAFSIFLREGFEAVLVIIVLLAILRAMNQSQAAKWVHVGWISAVCVGIIAWFAAGALIQMSGLSRELLEGAISLLAVVVLIYVGFWLHRYSEMKKWRAFLEEKLRLGLTSGSYIGLAIVSFFAVFREAFEVVLFLRAIWIDLDNSGQKVMGLGVLSSFVVLLGFAYFAVRKSKDLPLGKLFQACSWTMMILAIVLAGKGVHSLQEAGFLPISTLPYPVRFDLLGIYPSFQAVLLQLGIVALFVIFLLRDRMSLRRSKDVQS